MESNNIVTHFDVEDKLKELRNLLDTALNLMYLYPNQKDILQAINNIYSNYRVVVDDIQSAIDNVSIIVKNYENKNPSNNN